MSQLIDLTVVTRDGVSSTGTFGFDIADIVSPIRFSGESYFDARMIKGTVTGTSENLGKIEYRVVEDLATIKAKSSGLVLLTVKQRRGVDMGSEQMVFVASRISENLKPVGEDTIFFYHEDGDPLPVEYLVDELVADIVAQAQEAGTNLCVTMTFAEVYAASQANELVCGQQIRITDRGDQGLIVKAISSSELDTRAIRYMSVPASYDTFADTETFRVWRSVWSPTIPGLGTGDIVIYGGYIWYSIAGLNTQPPVDLINLDPSEWTKVPKPHEGPSPIPGTYYVTKRFDCEYDFANDWIAKQWDDKGNEFGISFNKESDWGWGFNWCDHSDWNIYTKSFSYPFWDNKCHGVMNNSGTNGIYGNKTIGAIYNNWLIPNGNINDNECSNIYENKCAHIRANKLHPDAEIFGNLNTGSINDNFMDFDIGSAGIQNMPASIINVASNNCFLSINITGATTINMGSLDISRWAKVVTLTSTNATESISNITNFEAITSYQKIIFQPENGLAVTFVHGASLKCEGAVNAVVDGSNGDWIEFYKVQGSVPRQSNIGTY